MVTHQTGHARPPPAATVRRSTLTRSELIDLLTDGTSATKKDVSAVVDNLIDLIADTVKSGERFALPGLGVFERVHRPARTARNPLNGDPVAVPERYQPKFKPAKAFKDAMPAIKPVKTKKKS